MPATRTSDRSRNSRSTSRGIFRGGKPAADRTPRPPGAGPADAEHPILFQQYFKSVGPRTYAAQVKRATNGNHYIVLTEGKRDDRTGEVRKTRLFVYSEDFVEFFKLMKGLAEFVKAHPVPEDVRKKRDRFWTKQAAEAPSEAKSAQNPAPKAAPAPAVPESRLGTPASR